MDRRRERDEDFIAFVTARSARLVHFARMLCGDPDQAHDMVQSALERAYLRWDRIEVDPFSYVRRAVVNQHLSWLRRAWRERALGRSSELDAVTDSYADDHSLAVVRREALGAALAKLTRKERVVVVLRFVEDQTEAETAAVLGIAVGTVKSTAARALRKLREVPGLADLRTKGRV